MYPYLYILRLSRDTSFSKPVGNCITLPERMVEGEKRFIMEILSNSQNDRQMTMVGQIVLHNLSQSFFRLKVNVQV